MPVLISLDVTSDRQFSEESSCKHRTEIANIHSHNSQHTRQGVSIELANRRFRTYSRYDTPAISRKRNARGKSTLNRHGIGPREIFCTTFTDSSRPCAVTRDAIFASGSASMVPASVVLPATATYRRLRCFTSQCRSIVALNAMRQRSIIARIIRKMQVPAKLPDDEGVQALEKSGVLCAFVKTMLMLIELELCERELELELISMPSMLMLYCCRREVKERKT